MRSYDLPSALNVPLYEWLGSSYDTYQMQINLLYSVYSLPNVVLPLVAGVAVDRFSPSVMMLAFSAMVCTGQALFAMGVVARAFPIMAVGRFLFGVGGESLEVAAASIVTSWFHGHRGLGLALGLNLASARVATAVNDNVSPLVAVRASTPAAMWVGLAVTVASFGAAVALAVIARRAGSVQVSRRTASGDIEDDPPAQTVLGPAALDPKTVPPLSDESSDTNTAGPSLDPEDPQLPVSGGDGGDAGYESEEFDEEDETVHLSQIASFGSMLWMLFFTTIFIYGAVVPFFHVCTDFMSIPDIISAAGSPLSGMLVDSIGDRTTLLVASCAMILLTHALLNFTTLTPIVPMVILGVAYSLFASALWVCVPFLVGRHQIATAYGLLTVALNLSLSVFPIVVAKIRQASGDPNDFNGMEIFFMALSAAALASCLALSLADWTVGGKKLLKPVALSTTETHPPVVPDTGEGGGGIVATQGMPAAARDELAATRPIIPSIQIMIPQHTSGSSPTSHATRSPRSAAGSAISDTTVRVVGEGLLVKTPTTVQPRFKLRT
ncbi:hypothetical protein HK105_207383 [Polyrhizophydium stewartii]|uniref:Lysosomal dipeptide transporter MFSD1 n=1 Tax=Polyrhizophydium stewartii TaxID=2732419 RepID=A0ABR4N106_9FUNG